MIVTTPITLSFANSRSSIHFLIICLTFASLHEISPSLSSQRSGDTGGSVLNSTSNVTLERSIKEERRLEQLPSPTRAKMVNRSNQVPKCAFNYRAGFQATNISYPKADQPVILPPEIDTVEMAFCYLDTDNTQRYWFSHFPHAAQSIFMCWSFFNRVRDQFPQANIGFWMNDDSITNHPRIRFRRDWVLSLVPQTGACTYIRSIPKERFSQNHTLGMMPEVNALAYRPPDSVKNNFRAPDWFARPEDAQKLQHIILGEPTHFDLTKPNQLRIGLVQRRKNRRITNLDSIQESLTKRYPEATIEQTIMEELDFFQQARWWAHHHIVVIAHGAAMTNLVFLSQDAGLVEVFPPHFYELQYFKKLSQSIGIQHHFQWINASVTDPEADYQAHLSDKRLKLRDVTPPVDDILELVQRALAQIVYTSVFERNSAKTF